MPRRVLAILAAAVLAGSPASFAAGSGADPRPWLTRLSFPTNLAWSPDDRLFFTEKDTGNVRIVQDGKLLPRPFVHLDVSPGGETGLLGIALAPGFPQVPWVYLYFSSAADQRNELVRVAAHGNRAGPVQHLLDLLPLRGIHNGGDLAFGTDGTLFVTVGEAGTASNAQDPASLGGKVLRLNPDGSPATDPLPGPAYSTGLRNSFGICVDPATGDLWETENGPSSDDEVNRIVAGGNYGWADQLGPGGESHGFIDPVLDYEAIIVPTGCAVWRGSLYFGAFDGIVRRMALPPGAPAQDEAVASVGEGITDLAVGPDGDLYLATVDGIDRITSPAANPIPTSLGVRRRPPGTLDARGWTTLAIGALVAVALVAAVLVASALTRRRRRRRALTTTPDA
jgi:glucose/arabinose dehydrogenase